MAFSLLAQKKVVTCHHTLDTSQSESHLYKETFAHKNEQCAVCYGTLSTVMSPNLMFTNDVTVMLS